MVRHAPQTTFVDLSSDLLTHLQSELRHIDCTEAFFINAKDAADKLVTADPVAGLRVRGLLEFAAGNGGEMHRKFENAL